jgi:spermidine synthase
VGLQAFEMSAMKRNDTTIMVSEEHGIRYLHFGSEWIQGAMKIARPFDLALDYSHDMMVWEGWTDGPPRHIVQLGLGTASLTKYCWKHYPSARITAVEIAPQVVACAYQNFKLPRDPRITIEMMDASKWVAATRNRSSVTILQVDLYDQHAFGPVCDTVAFYKNCRKTLVAGGMMTVNVFGEGWGFEESFSNIFEAFEGAAEALAPIGTGNRVVFACNS